MKTCTKCKRTLPIERFHLNFKGGKYVRRSRCAQCLQEERVARRERPPNPELAVIAGVFTNWRGPVSPNLGLRP